MKTLLSRSVIVIFLLALSPALAPGKQPADELSLVVTIVTGERGRDAHSLTTTLTLNGDNLAYQQSYHGAHSGGQTPVKKEYKLTAAERDELIKSMREKHLLITRTLANLSQDEGPQSYFSLLIRSKLNGEEHSIKINLLRTASKLKGERLYQDSVSLVEQLYRVIQRIDPDTSMPKLIY